MYFNSNQKNSSPLSWDEIEKMYPENSYSGSIKTDVYALAFADGYDRQEFYDGDIPIAKYGY